MTDIPRIAGVLAACGFIAVSVSINLFYATSTAKDLATAVIFGILAVSADLVKSFGLILFSRSLKSLRIIPALVMGSVWAVCVGYAMLSAYDFSKKIRQGRAGEVSSKHETLVAARSELARAEGRRKKLGLYDPPSVVEQKLAGLRLQPAWAVSKQCTEPTSQPARVFCANFRDLEGELVRATEGAKFDLEIATLRGKVETLGVLGETDSSGDDLAAGLARMLGVSITVVQDLLPLSMVMLIEVGSIFLLYGVLEGGALLKKPQKSPAPDSRPSVDTISAVKSVEPVTAVVVAEKLVAPPGDTTRHDASERDASKQVASEPDVTKQQRSEKKPDGRVEQFALACLANVEGGRADVGMLHTRYCAWCKEQGLGALSRAKFESLFVALCGEVGWETERRGGKIFCLGCKVRSVA